jgi:hypothetical protein
LEEKAIILNLDLKENNRMARFTRSEKAELAAGVIWHNPGRKPERMTTKDDGRHGTGT